MARPNDLLDQAEEALEDIGANLSSPAYIEYLELVKERIDEMIDGEADEYEGAGP